MDNTTPTPAPVPAPTPNTNGESKMFNLSIRGFLAILLTGSLCVLEFMKTPIDPGFLTLVSSALAFYFGRTTAANIKN